MSFTFLPRRTTTIAAGLVSAALLASLVGVESSNAAAGLGPKAVPAKCGKKCKKRRARNYIKNHSFAQLVLTPAVGGSLQTRYDFCANGTFTFQRQYTDNAGTAWSDSYTGTWSVASARMVAQQPGGPKFTANVEYTTANYQVSSPAYASPPPPAGTAVFRAFSDISTGIDGQGFTRAAGC